MSISMINNPNKEEIENTLHFVKPLPIFLELDSAAIQSVAEKLIKRTIRKGDTLFAQGDPGDAFYIVTSGMLRVSICTKGETGNFINDLKAGECVGEISLLTGQLRTATITALEDSALLCLKKSDFDPLAEEHPGLLRGLADQLLPRFQRDQTRAALKNYFGEIDDSLLRELLKNLDCCRCRSGEILFNQGDSGDAMYIVIQGRLRSVIKGIDGSERILSESGAGECVGEFALLAESGTAESLRTATVYATRQTDMIIITRPVFENLLEQYPQVLIHLTRKIVRRAVDTSKPKSPHLDNMVIALLPIQIGQSVSSFSEQLTEALSTIGSTLWLNSSRFDQLYGKSGASETSLDHPLSAVINAWLDERERDHHYTIYEVEPVLNSSGQLTPWAQRCVEDADLILLVGEAKSILALTDIEKILPTTQTCARLELALQHSADCQSPTATAEWLASRSSSSFPVRAYHHVRMGNQSDFRRLARRIVGRPVGLTLAGGAARGWAHLGVLRALEESNLEFDWVAGASMGSIVAAGCSLGWSSARLSELAVQFSNPKKLLDYTFPFASFTSTRHITSLLEDLYACDIEDTWKPFFCVSANLTQMKEIVHTTGPLWKAVRASMAFPGIFAPVLDNEGNVLLDGGAANNLPVDRMREMCPTGTVIGVDLITGSSVSGKYHFGSSLSGWQALVGGLSPFPEAVKAPHLFSIVAGLVEGICRYRLNEVWRSADLLIKVPVQPYGLLEFDRYAEIIDAGYRAAQVQLKELQ
jgi:predicted acylesterase/phospholipase RssA/CRP-like cAMP-binding protein